MLEGRNIILRLFREEDLEEFFALHSKLADRGEFYPISLQSLAETRKELNDGNWWGEHRGRMLITDKQGRMLGGIGFFQGPPYLAGYEIGYTVFRPEDRGHGYMTEALRIFSAYLFELKPIPRLQVSLAKGNLASRRVAEKCGYQYEGTVRKGSFLRGEYRDGELFSLLREEVPTLAEALQGQ